MIDFDDRAEAAYDLLLGHPGCSLAELVARWHGDDLEEVLSRLVTQGFAHRDNDGRYSALPPDIASDVLLGEHEIELRRAREYIARLAVEPWRGLGSRAPVAELVIGLAELRQRLTHLRRAAQHRVRCLDWRFTASTAPHLALLARGVECWTIYEHHSVSTHGVVADISTMTDAGERARVLPTLPLRAYLVDDQAALVPVRHGSAPIDSAVVLRPSALLDALHTLFETLWQRAIPLRLAADTKPDAHAGASRDGDEQLVNLLLSDLTTSAIARQLRVSERTAQRRITGLMADLGATTRFQAGVQAALRTLAPPPAP